MYLVDLWIPFPTSQYGGLLCVVAETKAECINLIIEETVDDYVKNYDYKELIENTVNMAKVFQLDNESDSGVVKSFWT
jgi:hypothetical protein